MKTDVQLLIAALTTERDSLDRAIASLRQIRTSTPGRPQKPVRRLLSKKTTKLRTRRAIRNHPADTKLLIVEAMRTAAETGETGALTQEARRLAKVHHMPFGTIYSGWRKWALADNGQPAPVLRAHDLETTAP